MRAAPTTVIAILALFALVTVAAVSPVLPSDSVSDAVQDSDAVISQSGNTVTVTYKNSQIPATQYSPGSDITVFDFGAVQGRISIVLMDAQVGNLTLFGVHSAGDLYRTLSVDFTMVSGSVGTLSLISVDEGAKPLLDTSYDRMYTLFRNVTMTFGSGTVTEICPTADMVGISAITYDFAYGVTVDRFYVTGVNGKYASVDVSMNGAVVGYMTNISSRVGSLEYDLRSGFVSFFCIGANTEHVRGETLSTKSTFLATGDVKVHVGPVAKVGNCIIGAGILNIPRIICNGETFSESLVHNITLDAEGVEILNDTLFFNDYRNAVYSLSDYSLDRQPPTVQLSKTCTFNRSTIDVYGPEGIWSSPGDSTISSSVSVYLNADYRIPAGSVMTVLEGGYLSNSGFIELSGSLFNYGGFISNGVVGCDSNSTIVGPVGGKAIVTDTVRFSGHPETFNVMVARSAASIILSSVSSTSSLTALLEGGYKSITVVADGSDRIEGDRFVLGISSTDVPEVFESAYRIDIIGIDNGLLSNCAVKVSLHTDNSKCTAVYCYDGSGYELVASCEYESSIGFETDGRTVFYTLTYDSDNPPVPVFPSHFKLLDYILCALIVALGITILYVLIRMRRRNDV